MRILTSLAVGALLFTIAGHARADDSAMQASVRAYYRTEMNTGFLFMAYGGVTAGAGGVVLTESGDFARGLGASSLILGGSTFLGGAAYAIAVRIRGGYFTNLVDTDPVRFKEEESER